VDVGEALNEIHESELYRQQATTLGDCSQQRWGFVARQTAYQKKGSTCASRHDDPDKAP
jgi:hypothetical protein